jgi:uncharacterized protein (DUF2235 family)
MSRNIVLLSDGTGNSAAKVWRTNVWRTFEALDLSGSDQVAFYDDGVGTSSFKPWAVLGGAFGFGLKRNVVDIYKFACRNYREDGDRLFGFGFSRGAFTIRVVGGLILNQGLVTAQDEQELDKKARAAYRQYRRERYHTIFGIEDFFRGIRDLFLRDKYDKADNWRVEKIHFVGVWDTVAAYGAPLDEMTRGISRYLWPLELPTHTLVRDRVTRACQALALDEERTTFHPELWNEGDVPIVEPDPAKERFIKDEQLSQVWFAGVHSNVGGGYPDDALAYIPFVWMITEAQRCGLKFKSDAVKPPAPVADPDTFKNAISKRDKDGRIYDPRAGLGAYYRYGPRKLAQLCNARYPKKDDDEVIIPRPKIHETVFSRIGNRAHAYAPVGLPPVYDVVRAEDGAILTPTQFGVEEDEEAKLRAETQEHVWNDIWKRRIVYFATVGATFLLLVFPLISGAQREDEFTSPIRWVSDLIRLVGGFLPGFASTWVDGYARAPGSFIVLSLLAGALMWWGTRIAWRIAVSMGTIWRGVPNVVTGPPNDFIYRLRSHPLYIAIHERLKRKSAPAFFAILLVYLGLCLASHLLYNVQDVAGFTCRESDNPTPLAKGETISQPIEFSASDICKATGIKVEGNGARYYVKVEAMSSEPWRNWMGLTIPIGGFSSTAQPAWYHRLLLAAFVPLRRELTQDWFRIVLRYGGVGGEEDFIEPDPEDYIIETVIKPTRKGELFIFVNDAVIGVPGLYDWFYRKNRGVAKLTVKRR